LPTAPYVRTHSSLQIDNSYGDWTIECRVCHDPHTQRQVRVYGEESYVYEGVVSSITTTTLSESGANWAEDEYKGLVVIPNVERIKYGYKITGNSNNILTVEGPIDLTEVSAGDTFAIVYGKLIKSTIELEEITGLTKTGNRAVRFFRTTGTNSFADGDATYDGVCEVCHTETTHFRNDGTGSNQLHTNVGTVAGTKCTNCHSHINGFAHAARGGGATCEDCHGHDPGYGGNQGGAGTYISHSTHTETDSDDRKGPNMICADCHDTSNFPYFRDGATTLAETTVCDECHSPGGVFDGVNDPYIGAKANWREGVYDGNTLKSGKEKWCAGCHDDEPSVIKGVAAPNVMGDNATYGYYISGHKIFCSRCHDYTLPHIDGEPRTYSSSSGNYQAGYRLKYGLAKSDPSGSPVTFCFDCHDSTALLGSQTNFRDTNTGMNGHALHRAIPPIGYGAGIKYRFGPCWDSDWNGIPDTDYIYCQACHNVHGSSSPRMIRHGELISTDTRNKVPGLDFRYYKADGVTPTTVLSESYYGDMPQIRGPSNTKNDYGSHGKGPYWKNYPGLKPTGVYYIGFTVCRTCHGLKYNYNNPAGYEGYNRSPRYYRTPLAITMPAGESVDLVPPTITSLSPSSGETGVAVNSSLTFTLSDSDSGVDFSTFSIELTGDKGYSRTYTDEDTLVVFKTGTPASYDVMVFPDVSFGDNETITVTVRVNDLASTPNFMASPTWYFKTGTTEAWQNPGIIHGFSDEDTAYPAANLIDNDVDTQWRPYYDGVRQVVNGRVAGKTGWITFDLGAYYEVHQVRIYGGAEGSYVNIGLSGNTDNFPYDVITNLLVDGTGWHESEKIREVGRYLRIYVDHDEPGYLQDSIYEIDFKGSVKAFTGIESITAYDTRMRRGIQAGDYVVIKFDGATNGAFIDASNIDSILTLNNGHSWLDGSGNIGSAVWSTTTYTNDTLTITLSTTGGPPSVAVGNIVTPDGTITDSSGNPILNKAVVEGSFDFVTDGVVAYWKFDEYEGNSDPFYGDGFDFYDETVNANHGYFGTAPESSDRNDPEWADGRFGSALNFTDAADPNKWWGGSCYSA
jgi:hypothetical protein